MNSDPAGFSLLGGKYNMGRKIPSLRKKGGQCSGGKGFCLSGRAWRKDVRFGKGKVSTGRKEDSHRGVAGLGEGGRRNEKGILQKRGELSRGRLFRKVAYFGGA